jgi:N-acetylglucosaminyl-diphospho-decaprenol L-rhamnosyltransferase
MKVFMPTFNGGAMLADAMKTIFEQTIAVECVVVDNGSRDGSIEHVEQAFPDAIVVRLGSNLGFGPALNEAVRRHPADPLIFANNDVLYEPRFLECLLDVAGEGSTVAGVLCRYEDPGVIDSAGVIVDETLLAFDYLHGRRVAELEGAVPPLGPTGGAALIPLQAFEAVGGFDGRIFAYLEDVDLALRLWTIGVRCRLARDARGRHRHSATLGSGSVEKNRLMGWSRGYLLRRYGVMSRPKRAVRALASEAVICCGQIVVDRTVSGASARFDGWHAARSLGRRDIPAGATTPMSMIEALKRRGARRSVKTALARGGD